MKKLEAYFKDYQITVFNNEGRLDREPIFIGHHNKKFVYLSFTGSHYNVIKSMSRFTFNSYYCHHCKRGYKNRTDHKCENLCKMCNRYNCAKSDSYNNCDFCNFRCNSLNCKRLHESKMCKVLRTCRICNGIKSKFHICLNQKFCNNCKKAVDYDHKYCILTEDEKLKDKKTKELLNGYIFFDYEAY